MHDSDAKKKKLGKDRGTEGEMLALLEILSKMLPTVFHSCFSNITMYVITFCVARAG